MTISQPNDGQSSPEELKVQDDHKYEIQIDGKRYHVTVSVMTGAELRKVPGELSGPSVTCLRSLKASPTSR